MLLSPPRNLATPKLLSARSSMSIRSQGDPVLPPITGSKITTNKLSYEESELKKFGTVAYTADIGLMMQIKQEMKKLIGLNSKLIKDNEATPEIQQRLSPIIDDLATSFEIFYRSGMHYFTQYYKIQQSAKANQVISSASCRIPIQTFQLSWDDTKKIIEAYTESHPPPHAAEIVSKFNGIKTNLIFIQKSNEQRKSPSQSLDSCISSILILEEKLSSHVDALFYQQAFPHFETDLLSSYANDVQSFKKIILGGFSNEFIHAGIPTVTLMRIKNMITSNCSSIIDSLKSAFIFPDQMREINNTKDDLQKLLDSAIAKLSVPFAVIKPLDSGAISSRVAPAPSLSEITAMENASAERKKHMNFDLMTKSIHNFIKTVEPFVGDIDETESPWQTLDSLQIPVIDAFNQIKELQEKNQELKSQMKEDVVLYTQKKTFLEQRVGFLQQTLEEKQKTLIDEQLKSKESDINNSKLNNDICTLQAKINVMTNPGDPIELRNSLHEILYSILGNLHSNDSTVIEDKDESTISVLKNVAKEIKDLLSENSRLKSISQTFDKFREDICSLFNLNTKETDNIVESVKNHINSKDENIKTLEERISQYKASLKEFSETNKIDYKEENEILKLTTNRIKDLSDELVKSMKEHEAFSKGVDKNLRIISEIISSATKDNTSTRISLINNKYDQNVADLLQLLIEQSSSVQPILDALVAAAEDRKNVAEVYKQKFKILTQRINDELKVENPPENFDELCDFVIESIHKVEDPYKAQIETMDSKISECLFQTRIIYARLCAITHKEVIEGDISTLLNLITDMLSVVQDNAKFDESLTSIKKSDLSTLRQTLEMIHVTLRKEAVKIDPSIDTEKDVSKLSVAELTSRVNSYVDTVTSPSYAVEYMSNSEIKKSLSQVINALGQENVQSSMQSNPQSILAAMQTEYMKMHNSVNALNDFFNKVSIAKKAVDENQENFALTFPKTINDVCTSLETAAKNIQLPHLLNALVRLTQIIQFFVSHIA